MRSLRATGLAVAFLAISAIPAGAEGFIVPYLGFNYGGNSNCASLTNCEEKRTNFGVSIGSMGNVVGFEQDFGFAKDFFGKVPGADNSVFTLMSNVLIGAGGGRVQPVRAVRHGIDPTAHVVERCLCAHVVFEELVRVRLRLRHQRVLRPLGRDSRRHPPLQDLGRRADPGWCLGGQVGFLARKPRSRAALLGTQVTNADWQLVSVDPRTDRKSQAPHVVVASLAELTDSFVGA